MIDILLYILGGLLLLGGIFAQLIGILTIIFWMRPSKFPADESNRINAIRLWWFALTRRELFVKLFPWLTKDELENMK
jgi:hypothetical protein